MKGIVREVDSFVVGLFVVDSIVCLVISEVGTIVDVIVTDFRFSTCSSLIGLTVLSKDTTLSE